MYFNLKRYVILTMEIRKSIILISICLFYSCQTNKEFNGYEYILNLDELNELRSEMESINDLPDTVGLAQFKKELKTGLFTNSENEYIYFSDLPHEYGLLITDHEYDLIDETYFELFYKNEKKIFKTSDLNLLKEKLSELPKGTILDWFDTCTYSKMMSFSDEKKEEIISICNSLEIQLIPPRWDEKQNNIVCYCTRIH